MGQERRRNERISRAFRRPGQARPLRRAREVAAWKHEPAALPSQRSLLRSAVGHVVDGHWREVRSGEHRAGARGSYVIHYGGKVHYDGAKDEETIIQVW